MENKKRLIDANALKEKLQEHHDFFVDGCGGFHYLTPKDKARVDEITNCIAEICNTPTVDAVVLPCKDDDIVFVKLFGRVLPFVVISTNIFKGTPIFKAQHGINLVWMFRSYDFGKTVFLTREEAEAALAKMDGDGNE